MPGLWQRLGGFGTKVIRTGQRLGRTLGEVLHLVKPVAPIIEPMAAARDWGRVSKADALTPEIAALRPDETVPRDLFTISDIPWADRFAYQVTVFGRDAGITDPKKRGQFRRQMFDMTVGREMTIEEAIAEAKYRFGGYEGSQMMEVFDVAVTGAWKSAEVEW